MAIIAFTSNGVVPNPSTTASALKKGDAYSGSTRAALTKQYAPTPDPFKSYYDAKRKLEQRAALEAKIQQEAQAKEKAAQDALRAQNNVKLFGGISNIIDNVSNFLTSEAPNFNVTTDAVGNPLNKPEVKEQVPVNKERGPERPGFIQQPQVDSTGMISGYNYVKMGGVSTPAGIDTTSNEIDNPTTYSMGVGADNAARMGKSQEDVGNIWNVLNQNFMNDAEFRNELGRVQEQIYGKPTMQELPNGEIRAVYDNEFLLYHGINADMQAAGYISGRVPDIINENATEAEKYEYIKNAQKGLYAVPLYKIGEEYITIATMTKEEKFNLQKKMKRAGYYSSTDTIIPGQFQTNDYIYYQAALGEANVAGLTDDQLFELRARGVKKLKAAGGGGGGGGAPTRTVDINFSTTTMANGRVLLSRVLQDALGRAPSDEELSQFMAMLNGAESKSPTKTITQYVNSGSTRRSTSRTTPSDVDPQALAEEFAAGIDGGAPMGAKKETDYLMGYLNSLGGMR
jgi:hypothetical protein